MKFQPDRNQITWSITIVLSSLLVMLMYYVIFKGGYIISGLRSVIHGMDGIVTGLVFGYVMSPVLNFIEDKIIEKIFEKCGARRNENGDFRMKQTIRSISIVITLATFLFIIWAFLYYIIPQLFQSITEIIRNIPVYYWNANAAVNDFLENSDAQTRNTIISLLNQVYMRVNSFVQESVLPNMSEIVQTVSKQTFGIIGGFFNLIVGFIVAVYVLNSKERFCGNSKKMAYAFFNESVANEIISSSRFIHATFTAFITGKLVDSAIIGVLSYVGNRILGIPYPMLIAVIVGLTNIIPFFGPYIGGTMGALILVLIDPWSALIFLIFVIVLQQFDGNILGPKILGNSTGLSSFWVIFAIMLFGSLWGFAGWILGVPFFAVIYALIRRITNHNLKRRQLPIEDDTYIDTAYIEDGTFHYLGDPDSTKYRSQKTGSSWSRIFRVKHKDTRRNKPDDDNSNKIEE